MNKSDFIKALESTTEYSFDQCAVINDVLENHFVFRKKNKSKVVAELSERLAVDEATADRIYEQAMAILHAEIKAAKRHPFGERK